MKKRKIISLLLTALMVGSALCGCAKQEDKPAQSNTPAQENKPAAEYTLAPTRKVIIDTDTGADDASALILAAKSGNLDILGVTVLVGNVGLEQSAANALMALEIAGSDAPVYKGSAENYAGKKIEAFSVFGSDGMGDAGLISPKRKAEEKDAIDFIIETAAAYPGELEIIAIGPATNIAKAIERDPETMKNVKMIWSMGTAGLGVGNASPVAEFNVYADPAAYKVMLDSGLNVTVVGLDMCDGEAQWTNAQFAELEKSGDIGRFVTASFSKLREFYASNGSADSVMNCDTLAMMCAVYNGFTNKTIQCHGSCIADPGETIAQVIFYQNGFTYDAVKNDFDYNVTLINDVNKSDYFDLYLKTIK
jgi:purine nucleosidase